MMKTEFYFIFFLFLCTCSQESIAPPRVVKEPIRKLTFEQYVSEDLWSNTIEIFYDENEKVHKVSMISDAFESFYEISYTNGQASQIKFRQYSRLYIDSTIVNYVVLHSSNKVQILSDDSNKKYEITFTDNYIDSFSQFYGLDYSYSDNVYFLRNEEGNIDKISVYATNQGYKNELTYEYYFSKFDTRPSVDYLFNQVYSWTTYIGMPIACLILDLNYSKSSPLEVSTLRYDGVFIDKNVSIQPTQRKSGLVTRLDANVKINLTISQEHHSIFNYE